MSSKNDLRVSYCQAERYWRSNNLRLCLWICDDVNKDLRVNVPSDVSIDELNEIDSLFRCLEIKCLAEDYHLDESLLLNDDDIQAEEQIRTFSATSRGQSGASTIKIGMATKNSTTRASCDTGRGTITSSSMGRQGTGMLTGRIPTGLSTRHGGRATSSYRPLTTSLGATQTAFSCSTRPLLKFTSSHFLCKPIYEYLYNVQRAGNKCPDYRQCLLYLNRATTRASMLKDQTGASHLASSSLISGLKRKQNLDEHLLFVLHAKEKIGAFWRLSLGICNTSLMMYKQAEINFQLAIMADPKWLDPYFWLSKVYMRLNQPLDVLKTCQFGLLNSHNVFLFNWKARLHMQHNELSLAQSTLRESLEYYPTNIEALANVGHCSFYDNQYELSLRCFERVNHLGCTSSDDVESPSLTSSTLEMCNNLALANLYCGNYARALTLFQQALLISPSREVSSGIWYNISFIALSFDARKLAIACLRLALRNHSQNENAFNNLGCLRYDTLIRDPLHYGNIHEYWSSGTKSASSGRYCDIGPGRSKGRNDLRRHRTRFGKAEVYFNAPKLFDNQEDEEEEEEQRSISEADYQPEMLHNMAVIKRRRGQLKNSMTYCELYNKIDDKNVTIKQIMDDIRELISHDN